jgi:tetratricopeptide (TPR) repeat protein
MSLRFLSFLAQRITRAPVLIVVTAREEETDDVPLLGRVLADLDRQEHLVRVSLAPLTRAATDRLVRLHSRPGITSSALASVRQTVWSVSGGNAFVAVEMLHAVRHDPPRGVPALPRKVHDLIAARLDRLGDRARELAAVAAVIAGDVDLPLLAHASGLTEADAADGLEELVRRRVLHGVGERFAFVHDRIRDVVLHRLLAPRRRLLHRGVAEAAERLYAADLDEHAAMLGRHFHAAEAWDRAVPYLRRAGIRALATGAQREAAACLEQAIDDVERLPDTAERKMQAIDLRIELRHALVPLNATDKIGVHLGIAEQLAEELGDRPRLGRVLALLANCHFNLADYPRARDACVRAVDIARALDDGALEATTRMFLGMLSHQVGDYVAGAEIYRRFLRDANEGVVRERVGLSGLTLIYARAYLCICLAELGEFSAGFAIADDAMRLASELRHPWALGHACIATITLATRQGDHERARAAYRWYRDALPPGGDVWPLADAWAAYAELLAGRATAALSRLDPATSIPVLVPAIQLWRAEAYLKLRRARDARALATAALELARRRGEASYESWALHLLGTIAASGSVRGAAEAEACYTQALAIARDRRMRPLEAHCHLGLGRLHARARRRDAARRELAAARAAFAALGMTRWLPLTALPS